MRNAFFVGAVALLGTLPSVAFVPSANAG